MKLSDVVANFIERVGVRHVFVVSGGASLHLIHSIHKTANVTVIPCHHEQVAAMAAEAYSRVSSALGVAIATSGPGATNLITGIAGAFYDSVPALYITGQVSTFRQSGGSGVRQTGFQETPIVEMVSPITKYAVKISDPTSLEAELHKAIKIAVEGRPGPVLVDIPDDLQRADVSPLSREISIERLRRVSNEKSVRRKDIDLIYKEISNSSRPVLIAGWGVRLARAESAFIHMAEELGIPVAVTWGIADLFPFDHPLRIGTFGTHGNRAANFSVQNADLIISVGSRLDTKATGTPEDTFARKAKKIMIDIDCAELTKFASKNLKFEALIQADAGAFIAALLTAKPSAYKNTSYQGWLTRIADWKTRYPVGPKTCKSEMGFVNPYKFFGSLSACLPTSTDIVVDTGCAVAWVMQSFQPRDGQRIWHDCNNTSMGWSIAGSIALALHDRDRVVICVVGDGSLMMNIQDLATIVEFNLNVKIVIVDNAGYAMIQQTQEQWLDSKFVASSKNGRLSFPDFEELCNSFGLKGRAVHTTSAGLSAIESMLSSKGPRFVILRTDPASRVVPITKFGRPNEDQEPLLKRKEFFEQMIIDPMPISMRDEDD
ncbi:thiamine pyrophosphate-binding protein [Litorivicinus sp.]|nr:thiamine pyrophosphate-binding protein [Litorivicinus sp.]